MQRVTLFSRQKGDTIVEVLIAIAVIGLVLGGAYSITNRSGNNQIQAREHNTALKIAETQLEQIRSLAKKSGNNLFTVPAGTAFNATSSSAVVGTTVIDSKYTVEDKRTDVAGTLSTFTVNVSWEGPTGAIESVGLVYKVGP